jgi:hypothetical protein
MSLYAEASNRRNPYGKCPIICLDSEGERRTAFWYRTAVLLDGCGVDTLTASWPDVS